MDKIVNHTNDDLSIILNDCTIYAVAFYQDSLGILVNFDFQSTTPQSGVCLYLIQEVLNMSENDKIVSDKDDNLIIRYGNGETKIIQSPTKCLGSYFFERDSSDSPQQARCNKIMSDLRANGYEEQQARILLYKTLADRIINNYIYYYNHLFCLSTFDNKKCLWITNSNQTCLPHVQFVGGYPDEWCAFLDNLTEDDEKHLYYWNKKPVKIKDLKK